jgi:multiple antibiotic resistance protein
VPLALPIMCGPGAIATVLGMTTQVETWHFGAFTPIVAAVLAAMLATYLCLAYAGKLVDRLGPMGIDAITRIVGFFVSAMGVGLVFNGVIEGLQDHGLTALH